MYLEIDEDFPEHPKTIRFCAAIANPIGWAYLIKLWRWCCKFQKDGDLSSYEPAEIEVAVGWVAMDGRFVAAAVKAGFIDHDAGGMRVHNWMKRQGAKLERLRLEAARAAARRARYGRDWEKTRVAVLQRDGFACVSCGARSDLDVHHIKPAVECASPEEANTDANLVSLCSSCHTVADASERARKDGS